LLSLIVAHWLVTGYGVSLLLQPARGGEGQNKSIYLKTCNV